MDKRKVRPKFYGEALTLDEVHDRIVAEKEEKEAAAKQKREATKQKREAAKQKKPAVKLKKKQQPYKAEHNPPRQSSKCSSLRHHLSIQTALAVIYLKKTPSAQRKMMVCVKNVQPVIRMMTR